MDESFPIETAALNIEARIVCKETGSSERSEIGLAQLPACFPHRTHLMIVTLVLLITSEENENKRINRGKKYELQSTLHKCFDFSFFIFIIP